MSATREAAITAGVDLVIARMDRIGPGVHRLRFQALTEVRDDMRALGSPYAEDEDFWESVDQAVLRMPFCG